MAINKKDDDKIFFVSGRPSRGTFLALRYFEWVMRKQQEAYYLDFNKISAELGANLSGCPI